MEWYPCSYSGGNLDSLLDTHGVTSALQTFAPVRGLPFAGTPTINPSSINNFMKSHRSGFYSVTINDKWYNVILSKHRNGAGDGEHYGLAIYSPMTGLPESANIAWKIESYYSDAEHYGVEKILLDSYNHPLYTFHRFTKDTNLTNINDASMYPYIANVENVDFSSIVSEFNNFWYVLNFGKYSNGGYNAQILMPYENGLADSEMFIRTAKGLTWRAARRVLHSGNYNSIVFNLQAGNEINLAGNVDSRGSTYLWINYRDKATGNLSAKPVDIYHLGNLAGGYAALKCTSVMASKIMFNSALPMIQAFDDGDGQDNGCELVVTGMGNTFVGAGESARDLRTALQASVGSGEAYNKTAERLYLTSDAEIFFYSNANTIGNRKGMTFDTSGHLKPILDGMCHLGDRSASFGHAYTEYMHIRSIFGTQTIVKDPDQLTKNIQRVYLRGDYIEFMSSIIDSSSNVISSTSCIYIVTSNQHFSIGIHPAVNNVGSLGSSIRKWNQVWATNGTIQTSDKHEKKEISYIGTQTAYDTSMSDETLVKFVRGLGAVVYKRKNGESGRPHHGFIAQDVEALMQEVGIKDHAAFIKSPVTETKEWDEEVENEDGTIETVRKTEQIDTGEVTYGLRYEEFIADIVRFIQLQDEKIEEQERKINSLEGRLSALENMLNPSQD